MTAIEAPWSVDACAYVEGVVGLRHGSLFVPGTDDVTPTRLLLAYDPAPNQRGLHIPIATKMPPLYAVIALPFGVLGWSGLVALNAIAYIFVGYTIYVLAARVSNDRRAAWLALGTWLAGSYTIEYAQAVWPHMLSAALVTAGVGTAWWATRHDRCVPLFGAGFLLGLASGVRYQNAVVALATGAAVFALGAQRWRQSAAFGSAFLIPLMASSAMNQSRFGSWNPISKGGSYLSPAGTQSHWLAEIPLSFITRIVDFRAFPGLPGEGAVIIPRHDVTGAYTAGLGVKKALLQSVPWALTALAVLFLAWRPASRLTDERHLRRFVSIPTLALLLTFTVAGLRRHDGLSHNQRYLIEVVPWAAIALALSLTARRWSTPALAGGSAIGLAVAWLGVHRAYPVALRHEILTVAPLVLALLALGAFALIRRRWGPPAYSALVGACLAYACLVHLGDDLYSSRTRRLRLDHVRRVIADTSPDGPLAVMAYWGHKDAVCPLYLSRDLVVADTKFGSPDEAARLALEFQRQGRHVIVVTPQPPAHLAALLSVGKAERLDRYAILLLPAEP